MKFQHVLLTRFNLRVDFSKSGIHISDKWLEHRFRLFEQYCYPSVLAQTVKNFQWLVFFDADTPSFYKNKIQTYAKWENFIPVFLSGIVTKEVYYKEIEKYLDDESTHLISTRLDNDDVISRTYIQEVQANFNGQSFEFISFEQGYTLDIRRSKLYLFSYPSNPFVNLIEKRSQHHSLMSAICINHTKIGTIGNVVFLKNKPGWLQIIHEMNVSNRARGVRVSLENALREFEITINSPKKDESKIEMLLDYMIKISTLPFEMILRKVPQSLKVGFKKRILKS